MDFITNYNMTSLYDTYAATAFENTHFLYTYASLSLIVMGSTLWFGLSSRRNHVEEINKRNAQLALMLMMMLIESPEKNQKYIRLAKSIGCDHLVRNEVTESD